VLNANPFIRYIHYHNFDS